MKQQVAPVNGRDRVPGSMSSSPASLDADVNSLSTTSSTASSCLPLVPASSSRAAPTPVSGKTVTACTQPRGTSNVRSVSGPGSIITYIDCNNSRHTTQHQIAASFCPDIGQEDDADDEEETVTVQRKSSESSCLQVRRGSEPVLTALHRTDDSLIASSDNSKRWSTAIAVDSSARRGCTQSSSTQSSESMVRAVTHSPVSQSIPIHCKH